MPRAIGPVALSLLYCAACGGQPQPRGVDSGGPSDTAGGSGEDEPSRDSDTDVTTGEPVDADSGDDTSTSTAGESGDESGADESTGVAADDATGEPHPGVDPGPVPAMYPGVQVGLCAPPGEAVHCYTGAPRTYNVGECGPGVQQCIALDLDFGEWGECEGEVLPALETCNALDDDCDGQIDEELGFTTCGIGPCDHTVPNCVGGVEQACDPLDGATPEVCDAQDNDCDGDVDEGLGDDTVTCGVGACEHGVTGCEGGEPLDCDPFAGAMPEVCNDVDDDCDGATDEGLGTATCGCGACEHTVPACINGFAQVCDPFEGASEEVCDGIDNDCDCDIDEDQGTWSCGQDACEVTVPRCIDGVPQPESTCQPIPGGEEICGDGIDNNCDGVAPPCAESFVVGTDTVLRPIDIVWAVDSSGSMQEEMANVEAGINAFADTLGASGSSTQLHLIADRGTYPLEICVDAPLGGAGCGDNAPAFRQYDTTFPANNGGYPMVHSSNALGRIMQQSPYWIPHLQPGSHIAFIVTTDDDGDDASWEDNQNGSDCQGTGFLYDTTTLNLCRWDAPGLPDYTSLAFDFAGYAGFATFMQNWFPGHEPDADWSFYSILGTTGTTALSGADDVYEFNSCFTTAEAGEEYVKLSQLTNRLDAMFSICEPAPWDLDALAEDIVSGVPNNLYVLEGSPVGTCGQIDPTTITFIVNGIPLADSDWSFDAATCTLEVQQNVPLVGDNVVIVYDNA